MRIKLKLVTQLLMMNMGVGMLMLYAQPGELNFLPPSKSISESGKIAFLSGPSSADPLDIAFDFLYAHLEDLDLEIRDLDESVVSDNYQSRHTGTTHIYLRQTVGGVEITNAQIDIHIAADGRVLAVHGSFVRGAWRLVQGVVTQSAIQATTRAAGFLGFQITQPFSVIDDEQGVMRRSVISDGGFARNQIPVYLTLIPTDEKVIRPAWIVEIQEPGAMHHWIVGIDAESGSPLMHVDRVIADRVEGMGGDSRNVLRSSSRNSHKQLGSPQYEVFAMPIEYPYDGPRTVEVDPASAMASPFGWHDTDGSTGAEFTITRGNNTHAFLDRDNNDLPDAGADVDGGAALDFTGSLVALDLMMEPSSYSNAAVVNLFYWVNTIHDVLHSYGFDEPSGNFQVNNYGNGGVGNDDVIAYAQKGADAGQFNNAFFGTPPDGSRPEMLMLEWNMTTPNRDGDFSSGIMAHEFGHGVSNRLTGGPSTTSCLDNGEQMGEGWSDFFGLVLTALPSDTDVLPRGIGVYALGEPISGPGIRQRQYTTDMAVNEFTYADLPGQSGSHQVGFLWCTIIWEVYWSLTNEYGFNPDFYGDWTTGGNNLAIQLVMDGMKLQPCSPGMVDGRDAILQADVALTGGANQCLLWRAFAKRGLGANADQGNSSSTTDGTADFDIPISCDTFGAAVAVQSVCAGSDAMFELQVGEAWVGPVTFSGLGEPAGTVLSFSPNPITVFPGTVTMTVSNTGGVPFSDSTITVNGTDGSTSEDVDVMLHVFDAVPPTPTLSSPADAAIDVAIQPTMTWVVGAQTQQSTLELATDAGFSNIVFTTSVSGSSVQTASRLASLTTYYWRVRAGNPCGDSSFSSVFSFTTMEQPDYFTELFTDNYDLSFMTITYEVDGSGDFYRSCSSVATQFPTDPTGGTPINLSDDDSEEITLTNPVTLYGTSYGSLFVGSNGYLTFGAGDTDYTETLADHFDLPRLSALFDDLNPSSAGTVSYLEFGDRVVVTYEDVPEYNTSNSNNFQIEMFFDGTISVTYLGVAALDGLSGLSAGNGLPADYVPSDLSAAPCSAPCPGDLNGDQIIDLVDLSLMVGGWGTLNLAHDFNGDNLNNVLDMLEVQMLFGPCGP